MLPPGTAWVVEISAAATGGPRPQTRETTGTSIVFTVVGRTTYRFEVTSESGNYRAEPAHGFVTLGAAHPVTKRVRFVL